MKRLSILFILSAITISLCAQNISRRYNRVPLTTILKELDSQQDQYDISFIYDDLRDFVITANVNASNVPDAIRQMIGFYPISVKKKGRAVLVECGMTSHRLTGQLVDENNQPVEYANIAVFESNSNKLVAGGVSDKDGRFVIPYQQNSVMVRISRVDKKTIRRTVTRPDMGIVRMTSDVKMLKTVVIDEKLVRHEPGVDIINATQLRKGKTNLVELLKDVPGLIVTENDITLPGKGSVKVMFNGRQKRIPADQLVSMLKAYQASNVAKIEIMREPDARFDAEGNFGVINIITEKQADYVGGSVGETVNYNTKWLQGMRGNLNYQHKRITASVNGNWTYGKSPYDESNVTEYTSMTRTSKTDLVGMTNSYNIIGSLDIMLDSLSTLGLEASYSSSKAKKDGNAIGQTFDKAGELQEMELSNDHNDGPPRENLNLSFFIDRNWSRQKSLSFIVDVFRMNHESDYLFNTNYADADRNMLDKSDRVYNLSSRKLRGASAALDFNTILPWGVNLSTGLKTTLSTTDNGLHYEYSTLPVQDNDFTYKEDIYAAYATLNKSLGSFSFRVGGRYEFTHTKGEPETGDATVNDYGRFYPNIVLAYNYGDGSTLQLSSRSGINRPFLRAMNPFQEYQNAYSVVTGNPSIEPSHWYNVQLYNALSFKGWQFSTSLRYARAFKIISQTTEMDATNNTDVTQWRNAYDKSGGYLDLDFYITAVKWMRASILTELAYERSTSRGDIGLPEKKNFFPYVYGFFRFFFDKDHNLSTSVTGSYTGRKHNATGILEHSYDLSLYASYTCLKNKLNIQVGLRNLLASNYRGLSYSNDGMVLRFNNDFSYRCVVFGVSYNFGKDIRTKQKQHSNTDINSRF